MPGLTYTAPASIGPGIYSLSVYGARATAAGSYKLNYTVGINADGAVPEPATWALMIVGFGTVGGAMRYRRRGVGVRFAWGAAGRQARLIT